MLFRCGVPGRERPAVIATPLAKGVAGRAEVEQNNTAIIQDPDIGRLNIEMKKPPTVHSIERIEDGARDIDCDLDLEMGLTPGVLVIEILLVRLPTQELHRQICGVVVLKYVAHPNNAGLVGELPKNFTLMAKRVHGCVEVDLILRLDTDAAITQALGNFGGE
jgi:hypothetical protein